MLGLKPLKLMAAWLLPAVAATNTAAAQSGLPGPTLSRSLGADNWAERESRYFPAEALRSGVQGLVDLMCGLTQHGGLVGCRVVVEDPSGLGFGEAALQIVALARENPVISIAPRSTGIPVPVNFCLRPTAIIQNFLELPEVVKNPDWVSRPTFQQVTTYYPRLAERKQISGVAVVECVVMTNRTLANCRVPFEAPAGFGFGDAALKMTTQWRMTPQTRNGVPRDGAKIRVPIGFGARPPPVPSLLSTPPAAPKTPDEACARAAMEKQTLIKPPTPSPIG